MDSIQKQEFVAKARKAQQSEFSKIAKFISRKGIKRLFHYTHISNLESILAGGLRTRHLLDSTKSIYKATDPDRFDGFSESISFSMGEPNRLLLPEKNYEFGHKLILLEVSANTLLTQNFASFPTNAASGYFQNEILNDPGRFIGTRGLEGMFLNKKLRDEARIPIDVPTDPQSEILFFDSIPSSLILRIHISQNFPADSVSILKLLNLQTNAPNFENPCQCGLFKRWDGVFRRYNIEWEDNG
jgi:hypothetical protein